MKAILVTDMPSNCIDCPCEYDYLTCKAINHNLNYVDADNERPSWCPLRPLPQKYCTDGNDIEEDSYWMGWNECIDEILGETNG